MSQLLEMDADQAHDAATVVAYLGAVVKGKIAKAA
jgi:hypothetical protein